MTDNSQEPVVEVEVNSPELMPPEGVIPGVQVTQPEVPDENVLFSDENTDFVLDTNPGDQLTFEQQQEKIKQLQAEMAKNEIFKNQQQVFQSGFETMTDKLGDVAKTQQEAYKKMQEQQVAELAKLQQQQPVTQTGYSDEQFATEVFTNPAQALQKYLVANVGPVLQQMKQENSQLRQQIDAVSSRSQYGDLYSKYGPEVDFQAKQLAAQGVKNPHDLAVQIIRGKHAEELFQATEPVTQPAQTTQPVRQPIQQSFSPTASQVPKAPVQQTRGKKRIPQSLYNEWVATANEKGVDVKQFTEMKAKYYNE